MSFTRINTSGVNSLSSIVAIVQDKQGFIWFGGKNGLARYDGYETLLFRYDPDDPFSIGSNDISDLFLDNRGTLWVATLSGGGLNRYDAEQQRFIRYKHDPDDSNTLGSNSVYAITEDLEGQLWLGTHGGGLNKFDPIAGKFKRIVSDKTRNSIADNIIRDLSFDSNGELWLATGANGLDQYNPHTGVFKHYRHHSKDASTIHTNELNKVFVDSQNRVWIGSFEDGISVLDLGSNKMEYYRALPSQMRSLGSGVVWDIAEDYRGNIWIATGNGELNLFNETSKDFYRFRHRPNDLHSLSGIVTSVFFDNANGMWLGSYFSSVDYTNLESNQFAALNLSQVKDANDWPRNVSALAADQEDNLWLATDKGIAHYDFSTHDLIYLGDVIGDESRIFNYSVKALHVDGKNNLWMGSIGGGLAVYDTKANVVRYYNRDEPRLATKIWSIHEDTHGEIWIGSQNAGLARLNPQTGEFTFYPVTPTGGEGTSNPFVWDITHDQQGNIWVATQEGLDKLEPSTGKFTHFKSWIANRSGLSSNSVRTIAEDREGNLWIGTDSGLNRYDINSGEFEVFRVKEGMADDHVSAVLLDKNDDVWMATQRGLSRYDKKGKTFHHFDSRYGVVGNSFPRQSFTINSKGRLFFGNAEGVTSVDPLASFKNDFTPPIVITDFTIDSKKLENGNNSSVSENIALTNKIIFDTNYSYFSIEFSALSFYIPSENRYAYKLEGYDKDWHYVSSENRRAVYTNLDPGRYVFNVRGSNNDGIWNNRAKQLEIIITPPWWMTWWARSLAAVIFVFLTYAFIAWRLRLNRYRQMLLKRMVHEKTRELASANEAIKQLNSELEERVERRTNELSVEIEERRHAEEKLFHMAFHDALTGLPNRYWLVQELKTRIEKLKNSSGFKFALMFLDGDRFKQINDTHGHLLGDRLLVAAAKRLKHALPENFQVVRLGGDEFTVLLDLDNGSGNPQKTAQVVIDAFDEPFFLDENKIFFKVSIGMVICEEFYSKPEQILRDADIALYRAKDKGKGVFQVFDSKMREEALEVSELENDLHSAINNDEFYLVFQPIVNLNSGKLTGFEALLRWAHPRKGVVRPDRFIPVAEECGLISKVGLLALEKACRQLAKWIEKFELEKPMVMSVNMSSLQVNQPDLIERIDSIIDSTGIDSSWLKLEITESALMEQNATVNALLENFRDRGMELAIDDFGTGYSSLQYLDQLPVQVLKIDRSFVSGISMAHGDGGGAMEIVRATISLAHSLRMYVVAEGIESEEQLRILLAAGCDFGQGFWIAKPLDAEKATAVIADARENNDVFGTMRLRESLFRKKYGIEQRSLRRT